MTDAHCHVAGDADRHFICSPSPYINSPSSLLPPTSSLLPPTSSLLPPASYLFHGAHPWFVDNFDADELRKALAENPKYGVGEIGLDRLKSREISEAMRNVFVAQLEIAADFSRPVVLHGAKCWGEVVKAARPYVGRIPAFLFHGFSRSDGLLPDIAAMNGFISIGPAILNDHAVNYRSLAAKIPDNILLVETDRTQENAAHTPSIHEIAAQVAKIRGVTLEDLTIILERNADRFLHCL